MGNETLYYYVRLNFEGDKWKRLNFKWGDQVDAKEVVEAAKRESELVRSAWLGTDSSGNESGYVAWFFTPYAIHDGSQYTVLNQTLASKGSSAEGVTNPGKMSRVTVNERNKLGSDVTNMSKNFSAVRIYEYKDFSNGKIWNRVLNDMKSLPRELLRAEQGGEEIESTPLQKSPEEVLKEAIETLGASHSTYVKFDTDEVFFGEERKRKWPASEVREWLNPSVPGAPDPNLKDLSSGVQRNLSMPLSLMSTHELRSLQNDIAKLRGDIQLSTVTGAAVSMVGMNEYVGPVVEAAYLANSINQYYTRPYGDIGSVLDPSISESYLQFSVGTYGLGLIGKNTAFAAKGLPAIGVGINMAALGLAEGFLTDIETKVAKQLAITGAEEREGEPRDLRWMVWREALFAKKAWEAYHSKVNNIFTSYFFNNPKDPGIKAYKAVYDQYANPDPYESVRLVNKALLDLYGSNYVGTAPYYEDRKKVGSTDGTYYSYDEDVLKSSLLVPLGVNEIFGSQRYVPAYKVPLSQPAPLAATTFKGLDMSFNPPDALSVWSGLKNYNLVPDIAVAGYGADYRNQGYYPDIGVVGSNEELVSAFFQKDINEYEYNKQFAGYYPFSVYPEQQKPLTWSDILGNKEEDLSVVPGIEPPRTSSEDLFQSSGNVSSGTTVGFGLPKGGVNSFLNSGTTFLNSQQVNPNKNWGTLDRLGSGIDLGGSDAWPKIESNPFLEPDATRSNYQQIDLYKNEGGTNYNFNWPKYTPEAIIKGGTSLGVGGKPFSSITPFNMRKSSEEIFPWSDVKSEALNIGNTNGLLFGSQGHKNRASGESDSKERHMIVYNFYSGFGAGEASYSEEKILDLFRKVSTSC